MEWKNANKILPERGHRVLCLYPNGKMDVQLYLGRESFVHDLYGRCIGCPLAGRAGRQFEFGRYPTYERAYLHAFERMLAERRCRNLPAVWQSGEEVLHWWLQDGVLPGQLSISDYLTETE